MQQRIMILERQKTNGMWIMIVPDYHLEKDSKMYYKGNAGITQWSSWTVSSERPMQLEFTRPVAKEETAAKRENPGDLQSLPWVWSVNAWEKNIWGQERSTQKD